MAGTLQQILGGALSSYGSLMHIPNMGFSQAIAGSSGPVPSYGGPSMPSVSGTLAGQSAGGSTAQNLNQTGNSSGPGGNSGPLITVAGGGGDVLGAQTGGTGGGGGGSSQQPTQPPSGGGGGGGGSLPSINDIFGQVQGYYENMKPQLQNQFNAGQDVVNNQYAGQGSNIDSQLLALQNQLATDRTNFDQTSGSAFSQAQNAYNQLLNRNLATYGNGSSTGPAIAAILSQGYQGQMGDLTNQNLTGHQNLAQQDVQTQQWAKTQHNQLDTWKSQAMLSLQQALSQGLNAINSQEGVAEQAKANARLDLLQNMINNRQALDAYDTQLRNNINTYTMLNNPSQFGVNQMNQGNYPALMGALNTQMPQSALSLQNSIGQSAGAPGASTAIFGGQGFAPSSTNDIYSQLLGINPAQQTSQMNAQTPALAAAAGA